ncbi:MAG: hypothetical protein HY927_09320 [Elusimicrobia bacterium]|nr:hypothetical protein [Elusimicrobiota bacterium]
MDRAAHLARLTQAAGCKLLYTLKPFSFAGAMELLAPHVAGFSVSSLFEAKLARRVLGAKGTVHMTTPGLRRDELDDLAGLCDHLSFNSLSQWTTLSPLLEGRAARGLRINPQLSLVSDERYNPCRKHSKLGVPLPALEAALAATPGLLEGLTGIHFHTNCDSRDLAPLLATVRRLVDRLGGPLKKLSWVNLGGGYMYGPKADTAPLAEAVELLREGCGVEVFIEPGAAFARSPGRIVASVIDLFDSDGATVAVLDTTVNHLPEVFEYQEPPDVAGAVAGGPHAYLLAGCSCLAGDVFGTHAFNEPLTVGSQVVFEDAGAYTMPKWHWFNGISLPSVYALTPQGRVVLKKSYEYHEFETHCGGR